MVDHDLRARGVRDERVLDAMGAVPRERFLPARLAERAYADGAQPIGEGQTISQPYIVAVMLEALELRPTDRVLEVGAGSGYVVALLDRLVEQVVGVERVATLTERAEAACATVGCTRSELHTADGTLGWPAGAPYDAILVSAGGVDVPTALTDQLADGGRLVIPVGRRSDAQRLVRVRRHGDDLTREDLGGVIFVPLIGEQGWPED